MHMPLPFLSDQELATVTVGAIGVHYDLPRETAYCEKLSGAEAEDYTEELGDILLEGGNNLTFNMQSLRSRDIPEKIRDEWVRLNCALSSSMLAASYYVYLRAQEGFEDIELSELVMSPAELEQMIGPELEDYLQKNADPAVLEDLKNARAEA